jgi:threonine/homoserine/homoserine lactone efflux protein
MPDLQALLLFVVAGWLLNLTSGPDVLCIVGHGLRGGARAGAVAALGVACGCCVHVAVAAAGLGALLATSAMAFALVKWAGGAYLLWVGVRLLGAGGRDRPPRDGGADLPTGRLWMAWRRGFLTHALNPKVALFFLAFVSQFIPADAGSPARSFLWLGLLFSLNALPVNLGYAWRAASAARRLQGLRAAMRWLDRVAGTLFVGFGLRLAFTDHHTTI